MLIRFKGENDSKIIAKGKELIKAKGFKISGIVVKLFERFLENPKKTIEFLYFSED